MTITRDQWLHDLIDVARPIFKQHEHPLPDIVRATLSPPHRKFKKVGLCWHDVCTEDKGREIWVSSEINDRMEVAGVMVHELCHAALPGGVGHRKPFVTLARRMLLEGKPTATIVGEKFKELWSPILDRLGPLPGSKFLGSVTIGAGQKTPQMLNVTCPTCSFFARIRKDQLHIGRLKCPADNEKMLLKDE